MSHGTNSHSLGKWKVYKLCTIEVAWIEGCMAKNSSSIWDPKITHAPKIHMIISNLANALLQDTIQYSNERPHVPAAKLYVPNAAMRAVMQDFAYFQDDRCIHLWQKRITAGPCNSIGRKLTGMAACSKTPRGFCRRQNYYQSARTRTTSLLIHMASQKILFPRNIYIGKEWKEQQSWQAVPNSADVIWFSSFW